MAKKIINEEEDIHSEDLQEIISSPPSWLLKRGISFVLLTILLILGLSVFIKYPEVVRTTLKFNTTDAPKVIVNKTDGNLTKILVEEGTWVTPNTDLAYLESTANHQQVLSLLNRLKTIRNEDRGTYDLENIIPPNELNLGELQSNYQSFYSSYLNYKAVNKGGIFQKRRETILTEVSNVKEQSKRIQVTYELQRRELALAEAEFEKYKFLAEKKVISPMELQQKEAFLLIKRQSLPQMENNIIINQGNLLSKNKELSEIDYQRLEEEKKFIQSLNSFISESENWKKLYVLTSPSKGKVIYGSFLQENQFLKAGRELFYINPNNEEYYGEMFIPQGNSSKVKRNQEVIIKVRSYPYQEYGYLRGKIYYISDIMIHDSVLFSKVKLIRSDLDSIIKLKPGVVADAEILTEDESIFKRIWSNLTKSLKI
ncbi:HlyD family secretion protein [Pedobacter gandavensis]|uniref:HlyD family secretion protein n=1 Tax=Pedobacter gandavensis TaxID=2679963 RepID=UPI00292DBC57|nr:HlyD family efflux transporter periplasmic adaptor subunit [Pedobacter gandavensis]